MAPRSARAVGRRASRLPCAILLLILALVAYAAYTTHAQAASHMQIIHHFHRADPTSRTEIHRLEQRWGGGATRRAGDQFVKRDTSGRVARGRHDHPRAVGGGGSGDASDPPPAPVASPPPPPASSATCSAGLQNTEYDGDVILAADAASPTPDPGACCSLCLATRGCNLWVYCGVAAAGDAARWCDGQCWLKRTDDPTEPKARGRGPAVPWTSGAVLKDFDEGKTAAAKFAASSIGEVGGWEDAPGPRRVALVTPAGRMRVNLRPDWHLPSVLYLQRLATERQCEGSCHLYRVEPGFLVQGTLRSFAVHANAKTLRGPKIMERGEIGWAGGGAGPDFFVYLGRLPADWLGHDHTVWGTLADEESLAIAESIVAGPSHTPGGPNTMRFLREKMYFTVEEDGDDESLPRVY